MKRSCRPCGNFVGFFPAKTKQELPTMYRKLGTVNTVFLNFNDVNHLNCIAGGWENAKSYLSAKLKLKKNKCQGTKLLLLTIQNLNLKF